jgi:hypothetical protein
MDWLRSTFLYGNSFLTQVRIKKNPGYYRLKNCSTEVAKLSAETRLEAIFINDIDMLSNNNLVLHESDAIRTTCTTYLTPSIWEDYGKILY